MKFDQHGMPYATVKDLAELIYLQPGANLADIQTTDPSEYNASVAALYADMPVLTQYTESTLSIDEYDRGMQQQWRMPQEYQDLDIAKLVLSLCTTNQMLQRVGEELILYQERKLFDLLRYLKYLVDLMRKNNIVWGVGRGSSAASYVLFLLGVHKIDALYYNLDISEFLK